MKILAVTGNRADYDLLAYLYKYLDEDDEIDFRIVVTGGHLSEKHGNSVEQIVKDGFNIIQKINTVIEEDCRTARITAIGTLLKEITKTVNVFKPDLIIVPGDREEVLAMGIVGCYSGIPVAHFFGGDYVSDGHPDNLIRNATSKLATIHFVTIQEHKERLVAIGENPDRICVVGNLALDRFKEEKTVNREEIMRLMSAEFKGNYALLIYHPPVDICGENHELENIMKVLEDLNIDTFVGSCNTDYNYSEIFNIYDKYKGNPKFYFYQNLDRNVFVNLYRNAAFQIGNSSSGIMESATIPIPAINVGSREKNRKSQENVVFISGDYLEILSAVKTVTSETFLKSISKIKNMYGEGDSSKKAYHLLKGYNFKENLLKTEDPLGGKNNA